MMKLTKDKFKNHPMALFTATIKYRSAKEKINALLTEARQKGYTILPANDDKYYGLVLFREIDGEEIAYNPVWDRRKVGNIFNDNYYGLMKTIIRK